MATREVDTLLEELRELENPEEIGDRLEGRYGHQVDAPDETAEQPPVDQYFQLLSDESGLPMSDLEDLLTEGTGLSTADEFYRDGLGNHGHQKKTEVQEPVTQGSTEGEYVLGDFERDALGNQPSQHREEYLY